MKKILITGKSSYLGNSFASWISKWPDSYTVDIIDLRNRKWEQVSFSSYDVIYHLAAIVHVKEKHIDKYFEVNRDLTLEIAKKAKLEGVKQFIFLSTMGVYGMETGFIDNKTLTKPKTAYAKSKLEAEELLHFLEDDSFKIAILRPPIVYGYSCKGNYYRLSEMAIKLPIFPNVKNKRSMIFVDNLSEFVKLTIDKELSGVFFPQNKEYVHIAELVSLISKVHEKEIKLTGLLNFFVAIGVNLSKTLGKVFGTCVYDTRLPGGPEEYAYETCSFKESIAKTEIRNKNNIN